MSALPKMGTATLYPPRQNSPYMKVDNDNDGDDGDDYGKFRLSLKLDFDCNHDSVSASMKSGLLKSSPNLFLENTICQFVMKNHEA